MNLINKTTIDNVNKTYANIQYTSYQLSNINIIKHCNLVYQYLTARGCVCYRKMVNNGQYQTGNVTWSCLPHAKRYSYNDITLNHFNILKTTSHHKSPEKLLEIKILFI